MRAAVPLFLEDDTVTHIDWIAQKLSEKHNAKVSRSDAVAWLVRRHWMKTQKETVASRLRV